MFLLDIFESKISTTKITITQICEQEKILMLTNANSDE